MNIEEIKRPGQILDYVDTKEHLVELFNYITNLQEENEMLKKPIIVNWKNAHKIKVKSPLQARIDKAIETIEQLKQGSYIKYTDSTALAYHNPKPCCVARLDVIEDILRGEDNDNKTI